MPLTEQKRNCRKGKLNSHCVSQISISAKKDQFSFDRKFFSVFLFMFRQKNQKRNSNPIRVVNLIKKLWR